MSTGGEDDVTHDDTLADAYDLSELSEAGRIIDAHRTRRRLTKGALARSVGISRQQLWRVMTGKSALVPSLRDRLVRVLGAEELATTSMIPARPANESTVGSGRDPRSSSELMRYLRDPAAIARTLDTLPGGSEGRWLYRAVFDVIEEMAAIAGIELSADALRLRRGAFGEHLTDDVTSISPKGESSRSA
jgi:hypothetical protein